MKQTPWDATDATIWPRDAKRNLVLLLPRSGLTYPEACLIVTLVSYAFQSAVLCGLIPSYAWTDNTK